MAFTLADESYHLLSDTDKFTNLGKSCCPSPLVHTVHELERRQLADWDRMGQDRCPCELSLWNPQQLLQVRHGDSSHEMHLSMHAATEAGECTASCSDRAGEDEHTQCPVFEPCQEPVLCCQLQLIPSAVKREIGGQSLGSKANSCSLQVRHCYLMLARLPSNTRKGPFLA